MEKTVRQIVEEIKQKINQTPEVAMILGSGLSYIADEMEDKIEIPYNSLSNMPTSHIEGHSNKFVVGKLNGKTIIAMLGRFHLYDGFSAKQVAMPIYIFKELGVKTLIVTNASGGVDRTFNPGDIMLITDQINHTGQNALIGGPIIDYGTKFIDMTEPYNQKYIETVKQIAKDNNIDLKEGTYIQYIGPFYETKADIKMVTVLGASAIGMSTAIEVEAARQCDLNVLGLSIITNKATGLGDNQLSHSEVLESSKKASNNIKTIVYEFLKTI